MTINEAIDYFGNLHRTCQALGIAVQNMTRWKRQGYIPLLQQYRIAELTDGELMPDEVDPKTLKVSVAYANRKRKNRGTGQENCGT